MKKITLIILGLALLTSFNTMAQGVAINDDGDAPANSAMLDITSSTKGILIPRMTETERNNIDNLTNNDEGLMIYQTDNTPGYYFYDGSSWELIGSGALAINNLADGKTNSTSLFIGENAGLNNTGSKNTAVGIGTLQANTTGSENTATGYLALSSSTTGYWNTANGYNALHLNNSYRNTAMGSYALSENVTGMDNTAVGHSALRNNTAYNNTAIGSESLFSNTTGNQNTACGFYTLYYNTSGVKNIAIGNEALYNNSTGQYNLAIGNKALFTNSTGDSNTAIGNRALYYNTSGQNTAIGFKALYNNSEAYQNSAVGYGALINNTVGDRNSAIGFKALRNNTSGEYNIAVGGYALAYNVSGIYNVAFGYSTGPNNGYTDLDNTIAIGCNTAIQQSNRAEIGNSSIDWIGGEVTWSTYSDKRIKENIKNNVPGLDFIMKLKPVSYNFNIHKQNEMLHGAKAAEMDDWDGKYDIEKKRMTGFLAQDVAQAANELNYEFSGVTIPEKDNDLYSLSYAEFVVPLVKAVQELEQENELLRNQLAEIANRLNNLEKDTASKNTNHR